MLGDNSEKSKNPLKKAMRRRNAKTVNFAAPTYIEASDVEFSSDEDSEHGDFFDDETLDGEEEETQDQNEDIVVEPLRPRAQKERPVDQSDANGIQDKQEPERPSSEQRRSSEEFFDPEGKSVFCWTEEMTFESNSGQHKQSPPLVGPEMAPYGTRTLSSRTTPPNQRRCL